MHITGVCVSDLCYARATIKEQIDSCFSIPFFFFFFFLFFPLLIYIHMKCTHIRTHARAHTHTHTKHTHMPKHERQARQLYARVKERM
jgi:ATP/ADP translocase